MAYPDIRGAVIHSDRGTQYTSELYRNTLRKYEIIQSMYVFQNQKRLIDDYMIKYVVEHEMLGTMTT